MEREKAFLKHGEVVQPFLIDAFKEGAHRIKPKYAHRDQRFRQIMIGVVYNDIGSSATEEELADKYGTFRQSVSISNRRFLRNLWNNSSPELKGKYPLEEILSVRKSLSQRSRERISAVKGGTSLKIKAQVEIGITDRNEISKNTGLPKSAISAGSMVTLKGWGIDVPREVASYREDLKQLEEETDDKKIQETLDKLPLYVIRDRRGKRRFQFSSLSPLIREAGFRSKYNHPFAASLETAGIPISRKDIFLKDGRRQTYYILLSRHIDRAIQALQEDKGLQRFRR